MPPAAAFEFRLPAPSLLLAERGREKQAPAPARQRGCWGSSWRAAAPTRRASLPTPGVPLEAPEKREGFPICSLAMTRLIELRHSDRDGSTH
jgi:hypothetical protein